MMIMIIGTAAEAGVFKMSLLADAVEKQLGKYGLVLYALGFVFAVVSSMVTVVITTVQTIASLVHKGPEQELTLEYMRGPSPSGESAMQAILEDTSTDVDAFKVESTNEVQEEPRKIEKTQEEADDAEIKEVVRSKETKEKAANELKQSAEEDDTDEVKVQQKEIEKEVKVQQTEIEKEVKLQQKETEREVNVAQKDTEKDVKVKRKDTEKKVNVKREKTEKEAKVGEGKTQRKVKVQQEEPEKKSLEVKQTEELSNKYYFTILLTMISIATFTTGLDADSLKVMHFAQVANGFLLPVYLFSQLACLNDPKCMNNSPQGGWANVLHVFCVIFSLFLSGNVLITRLCDFTFTARILVSSVTGVFIFVVACCIPLPSGPGSHFTPLYKPLLDSRKKMV